MAAESISWISGWARNAWAEKAAERLKAQGRPAFVITETALGGFPGDDPVRTAREVAHLMSQAGVHVLITLETSAADAHPGRIIDADDDQDGGDAWVI